MKIIEYKSKNVKRKSKIYSYFLAVLFIILICLLLLSTITKSTLVSKIFNIYLYSTLTLFIILFLLDKIGKGYKEIGDLYIMEDKVVIKDDIKTRELNYKQVTLLKIEYCSYKGETTVIPGSMMVESGADNMIKIKTDKEKIEYYFLCTHHKDYQKLLMDVKKIKPSLDVSLEFYKKNKRIL